MQTRIITILIIVVIFPFISIADDVPMVSTGVHGVSSGTAIMTIGGGCLGGIVAPLLLVNSDNGEDFGAIVAGGIIIGALVGWALGGGLVRSSHYSDITPHNYDMAKLDLDKPTYAQSSGVGVRLTILKTTF